MPKAVPEFIPSEIKAKIDSNYAGVMEFSETIGLKPQRLLTVFGGTHGKLRPYMEFTRWAGITMDEMAAMMANGTVAKYIEDLANQKQISIREMERQSNVGRNFLQTKLKTGMHTNGLSTYIEVATALGWSLQKLAETCLR